MHSNLIIKVEILAGTHVRDAIQEMINLRQRLGVNIEASFNGENIFVCRDDQTIDSLEGQFDAAISSR